MIEPEQVSREQEEARRGPGARTCRAKLAAWQVEIAQDEMRGQLRTRLRIGEIAARLDLSTGHFSKAFRNTVGLAPSSWFQRARLLLAMRLMQGTRLTLAQIAGECGYTDESHLSQRFERLTGTRPGRWRRDQAARAGSIADPSDAGPLPAGRW